MSNKKNETKNQEVRALSFDELIQATKERKANNGKAAVVWTDKELDMVAKFAAACTEGTISQAALLDNYKAVRKAGLPYHGIEKSASAFAGKLAEIIKEKKAS
jgi:hypothetical protein